jgi:hypothetical protein
MSKMGERRGAPGGQSYARMVVVWVRRGRHHLYVRTGRGVERGGGADHGGLVVRPGATRGVGDVYTEKPMDLLQAGTRQGRATYRDPGAALGLLELRVEPWRRRGPAQVRLGLGFVSCLFLQMICSMSGSGALSIRLLAGSSSLLGHRPVASWLLVQISIR